VEVSSNDELGELGKSFNRMSLEIENAERLRKQMTADIAHDLRTLSQSDSGELLISREAVEPASLLNKVSEVFRLQAEQKGIGLAVKVDEGLPVLSADEGRLMQVLENLVANAIRHTPTGGQIALGVSEVKKSHALLFTVTDNGEGIPAEELPLIFERFHRVDKSRHADSNQSGLGLAIARAIVEAHGGKIWAESTPGKGTTISFELPLI
jgi:signal transduction histidine kinase